MANSVGEPGKEIKGSILVSGENVAEVGAIEDILECRKDFYPYRRAIFARDESAEVSIGTAVGSGGTHLAE